MNAHNMNFDHNTPALQRSLSDVVAEYDLKLAGISQAVKTFSQAGDALKMAVTVAGVYGDMTIDTGHLYESDLKLCLLKSAWKHVYEGLNIDRIASADDKRRWQQALAKPEPFTIDNIRATFGRYILDPRGNILRALAEVFCQLDRAYKSHDKVKIGVAGLPKPRSCALTSPRCRRRSRRRRKRQPRSGEHDEDFYAGAGRRHYRSRLPHPP